MDERMAVGQVALDFELTDVRGRTIRLSDYRHKKNVVLVFTRGFI
jgi:peroxiredoxin